MILEKGTLGRKSPFCSDHRRLFGVAPYLFVVPESCSVGGRAQVGASARHVRWCQLKWKGPESKGWCVIFIILD